MENAMHVHSDVQAKIKFAKSLPKHVTKHEVEGVSGAFVLQNVMTHEECHQWIQVTEELGYTEAPVSTGYNSAKMMKDVRDNKRVMWQVTHAEMDTIWGRVKDYVPQTVTIRGVEWEPVAEHGLNERFRFYKYAANEYFLPHLDGCFARSSKEQSHLTFIIYLNEGFEGGETGFFPVPSRPESIKVNPKEGQALLFFHSGPLSPVHEGAPHFSKGKFKYVLRSDIMYKRKE